MKRKLITLSCLFFLLALYFHNPHIKKVTENELKDPYIEFTINPTDNKYFFNIDLNNPGVRRKPSTLGYIALRILEEDRLAKNEIDPISLAKKRINEVNKYHKEMEVLHNYSNVQELKNWQDQTESNILSMLINRNKYLSWEAEFAQYVSLMEKAAYKIKASKGDLVDNFRILKNYVVRNQEVLSRLILSANKSDESKLYLLNLNKEIADYLFDQTIKTTFQNNTYNVEYNLSSIVNSQEFGQYVFHIHKDQPDISMPQGIFLWLAGRQIPIHATTPSTIYFQEAVIDQGSKKVSLEIPPVNLFEGKEWAKARKADGNDYYYEDIELLPGVDKYLISFDQAERDPLIFQLLLKTGKSFYTYSNEIVLSSPKRSHFEHFVEFIPNRWFDQIRLLIFKKEQTDSALQPPVNTQVNAFIEPEIDILRNSYLRGRYPQITYEEVFPFYVKINIHNPSSSIVQHIENELGDGWTLISFQKSSTLWQYQAVYIPFFITLIIALTCFFFAAVKIKKPEFSRLKFVIPQLYLKKWQEKVTNLIRTALLKTRLPLIIFTLFTILIFLTKGKIFEFIIPLIIVSSILSLLAYEQNIKIAINIGLFIILPVPVLLIFRLNSLAERVTTMSYLLLSTGIIWSLISRVSQNRDKEILLSELIKGDIVEFIAVLPRFIRNPLIRIYHEIKQNLIYLYSPLPTETKKNRQLILRLIITGYLFSSLILSYQSYQTITSRFSLNPSVSKYEPRIVYRSTKVLIKGKGFGWKENESVKLKHGEEEVYADYWSPTKIIFTVPLDWKYRINHVWIEKSILWKGEVKIAKSRELQLNVIPAGKEFGPEDELFFKQLKSLEEETLQINGYSRGNY